MKLLCEMHKANTPDVGYKIVFPNATIGHPIPNECK